MVRRPVWLVALILVLVAATTTPAQARTAAATSANWAGYAVTRSGGTFKHVTGQWTVPVVGCTAGQATSSANWIGLGGFEESSQALEQLGTESDCTASGKAVYSAWFEVVPAASTDAKIRVRAGDKMAASVTVSGKRVRMRIMDLTRGTSQQKTVSASSVDLTSAEWIVEAPSLCQGTTVSNAACFQTELADFGSTAFTSAKAMSSAGHVGGVGDPLWTPIAITLQPSGATSGGRGRFTGASFGGGAAIPGALTTATSFGVTYADAATVVQPSTTAATAATLRSRARTD